jgi:ATP-dependent exoDNAse (exonuclease V) beta subunit
MKFISSNHTYINDNGDNYTSVTTIIKKYCPQKDWNQIAEKYAKKVKKSVEEVQAAWKEEGAKAVSKGTAYHEKMETLYKETGLFKLEDKDCIVYESPLVDGIKKARDLKLDQGIYPELLIFSHKYKVAGQADLVEIVNGKINIKDYKTNKKIDKESYKHWKDGHEMMLFPVNQFMNCNFWHYALQLNIYMFMLRAHNPKLKMGEMYIYHIKEEDNVEPYLIPDLQSDVKRLLEHFKEQSEFNF